MYTSKSALHTNGSETDADPQDDITSGLQLKHYLPVFERYLSPTGLSLRIVGLVQRDIAHIYGVPHGSVQIGIGIYQQDGDQIHPYLLLHRRSPHKKVCPEKWDICGGHIELDITSMKVPFIMSSDNWDDQGFIANLCLDTALREANEEFRIRDSDFEFKRKHLRCFTVPGAFEQGIDDPCADNREYSTFYMATVPRHVLTLQKDDSLSEKVTVLDSITVVGQEYDETCPHLRLMRFPDLVQDFNRYPEQYADGIGRILSRAVREPGTIQALRQFVEATE